jgi:hypothetical protein
MAWRGRVSPTTSTISAGPRDWVSWRGGESEITNASLPGTAPTHHPSGAGVGAGEANSGLAHLLRLSLTPGGTDSASRRRRRGRQGLPAPCPWARQTCSTGMVYKSSLSHSHSLSMPAGSACERSDKPPAAPVRPSPVNSILRLL